MSDYYECPECGVNEFCLEWGRIECKNGHGVESGWPSACTALAKEREEKEGLASELEDVRDEWAIDVRQLAEVFEKECDDLAQQLAAMTTDRNALVGRLERLGAELAAAQKRIADKTEGEGE